MGVLVRRRAAGDAAGLLAALEPVHEQDGYPLHRVHLTSHWLYDGIEDAWVAELDGRVIGHIAVAKDLQLTRFFVATDARGTGAGSALLDVVESWADALGHTLTLDVVEHNTAAQALYRHRGWEHTGNVVATWVSETGPWPDALTFRRLPTRWRGRTPPASRSR
ncbi:GNAT family N-acetyltransferase [Aeromicrobium sp. CTD01-1L150]|uniref:GNAT family N-acetyltransferase n=1 Tax=Aeromicrobium sp. CTD01-1L150 TaxID=3341830 RepID=UPI0035C211B9